MDGMTGLVSSTAVLDALPHMALAATVQLGQTHSSASAEIGDTWSDAAAPVRTACGYRVAPQKKVSWVESAGSAQFFTNDFAQGFFHGVCCQTTA